MYTCEKHVSVGVHTLMSYEGVHTHNILQTLPLTSCSDFNSVCLIHLIVTAGFHGDDRGNLINRKDDRCGGEEYNSIVILVLVHSSHLWEGRYTYLSVL